MTKLRFKDHVKAWNMKASIRLMVFLALFLIVGTSETYALTALWSARLD